MFYKSFELIQQFWFDGHTNTEKRQTEKWYNNDINVCGFTRVNLWKKPTKIYSITSKMLLKIIT